VTRSHLTVTVVIPTICGREELLARALASVDAQARPPDAVIVEHDDHDPTAPGDGQARGLGAWHARNRALTKVTTDLVAWLDDDDELLPNHLQVLAGAHESAAADGATADVIYPTNRIYPLGAHDPAACPVGGRLRPPWGVPFGPEQARHILKTANFIPITYVARTATVRAVGGFPQPGTQAWPHDEDDWGLLWRLVHVGARIVHIDAPTWVRHLDGHHTGGHPQTSRGVPLP
jgi:glycosyltransferase involved in cell wall biosynthesis